MDDGIGRVATGIVQKGPHLCKKNGRAKAWPQFVLPLWLSVRRWRARPFCITRWPWGLSQDLVLAGAKSSKAESWNGYFDRYASHWASAGCFLGRATARSSWGTALDSGHEQKNRPPTSSCYWTPLHLAACLPPCHFDHSPIPLHPLVPLTPPAPPSQLLELIFPARPPPPLTRSFLRDGGSSTGPLGGRCSVAALHCCCSARTGSRGTALHTYLHETPVLGSVLSDDQRGFWAGSKHLFLSSSDPCNYLARPLCCVTLLHTSETHLKNCCRKWSIIVGGEVDCLCVWGLNDVALAD